MSAGKLHLRIITPSRVMFEGEVDMVIARAYEGEVAFLYNHIPITLTLDYGLMRIMQGDETHRAAVLGGIVELYDNRITVISERAEWANDIDTARAREEKEQAERQIRELTDRNEIYQAQLTMRRSAVRLEVSSYAVTKGHGVSGSGK